ncbi:MAG: MFS transporter [Microbacterium sp.]|uniref:MFS transporter n=1 Tax=Microbacterium sp. TaxID=51671 RepID=UPI0039E557C2
MTASVRTRRNALFVLFFLPGIVISSWVTRTPDIRDATQASTAEMGLIIAGLSVGSMLGVLSGGPLVARLGARRVSLAGVSLVAAGCAVIGVGGGLGIGPVVALGLGLFGLGVGAAEIGLNVEGGEVERGIGRSTLPMLHGAYSLGTVVGAAVGVGLTAIRFPVLVHLVVAAAIVAVALVFAIRPMPADIGIQPRRSADDTQAPRPQVWRDPRLLLIGFVVLALGMAEGTANDWLPLLMVDGHGLEAALASGSFALFAITMTIGRFAGGWFVDRFGKAAVLGVSAAIGAVGIGLVSFVDDPVVAVASVVLWGLGAALGFPVALSAAGESGPNSAARVSLAASIGYIAFLVGPPLLGFLGEAYGLRGAILVVLALVALAIAATTGIRPAHTVRARG